MVNESLGGGVIIIYLNGSQGVYSKQPPLPLVRVSG